MFADSWVDSVESGALTLRSMVTQQAKNPISADPSSEAGCPPGTVRAGTQGQAVVCRSPEEVYIKATGPRETETNYMQWIALAVIAGVFIFVGGKGR